MSVVMQRLRIRAAVRRLIRPIRPVLKKAAGPLRRILWRLIEPRLTDVLKGLAREIQDTQIDPLRDGIRNTEIDIRTVQLDLRSAHFDLHTLRRHLAFLEDKLDAREHTGDRKPLD